MMDTTSGMKTNGVGQTCPEWMNLRCTMADMDTVERMAKNRATAAEIGIRVGASNEDVRALCNRNNIRLLPPRRRVPGLAKISFAGSEA